MTNSTNQFDLPAAADPELKCRLSALRQDCQPGSDKHDQVTVLIHACIADGVTEGRSLIHIVSALGFHRSHVGIRLKEGLGHHWQRDVDRRYSTLPLAA